MTEFELNKLKDLPTPTPSKRAKVAALDAARAAFAAHSPDTEEERAANVIDLTTQGNTGAHRHSFKTSKPEGLNLMRLLSKPGYAIAATLTAVSLLALGLYGPAMMRSKTSGLLGMMSVDKEDHGGFLAPRADFADKQPLNLKPKTLAAAPPKTKPPVSELNGKKRDRRRVALLKKPSNKMALGLTRAGEAKPRPVFTPAAPMPQGYTSDGVIIAQDRIANLPTIMIPKQYGDLKPQPEEPVKKPGLKGRDKFEAVNDNPVKTVKTAPVSTFSLDVDTAAYAFMRRALNAGRLPQKASVRIEELINYFSYDYGAPTSADTPFRPIVTIVPSPWNAQNKQNKLMHIAIKGYTLQATERPRANLVFLIDVSGSMQGEDRLPLLKNAFRMLVNNLKPDDTIGIVTYASGSGIALPSTKVANKGKILAAIDALGAGGSTAGAKGIRDAYALAQASFDKGAVNRIILGTDGDFNVGISDRNELKSYIERKRKSGVFLSILGVGRGNYNDALMQTLAQNGNGTAAYIDTLNEARKVLVEEASSSLFPIAKDVKIQIEFNPARVKSYRLIGYETRALRREDFNNDKVDAGDVGSGHAITAIYEITPVGAGDKLVDDLRYGKPAVVKPAAAPASSGNDTDSGTSKLNAEFGYLKLRYKLPGQDKSRLIKLPITQALAKPTLNAASTDTRFSIAVAAFGQLLRGGAQMNGFGFDDVIALASSAKGPDRFGLRAEFINLVRLAKSARP